MHEAPHEPLRQDTSEREALVATFEELRAIKVVIVVGTIVAIPLMVLGIVECVDEGLGGVAWHIRRSDELAPPSTRRRAGRRVLPRRLFSFTDG